MDPLAIAPKGGLAFPLTEKIHPTSGPDRHVFTLFQISDGLALKKSFPIQIFRDHSLQILFYFQFLDDTTSENLLFFKRLDDTTSENLLFFKRLDDTTSENLL